MRFCRRRNPGERQSDGVGEGDAVSAVPCVGQTARGRRDVSRAKTRTSLGAGGTVRRSSVDGGPVLCGSDSPENAQSSPAVPADHECEALLLKVEKQISDGRTATPPDDNALLTWQSVITRVEPASPGTLHALQDFVTR